MKGRKPFHKRTLFLGGTLMLIALFGLQGCFRGHWHSRYSPERMEERMEWVEEEVADTLEIRPEQQASFQALTAEYKEHVRGVVAGWRQTLTSLNGEFAKDRPDTEGVASILKDQVRRRASDDELDRLIDLTVEFYKSLDPEQQEIFNKKVARHLDRHL